MLASFLLPSHLKRHQFRTSKSNLKDCTERAQNGVCVFKHAFLRLMLHSGRVDIPGRVWSCHGEWQPMSFQPPWGSQNASFVECREGMTERVKQRAREVATFAEEHRQARRDKAASCLKNRKTRKSCSAGEESVKDHLAKDGVGGQRESCKPHRCRGGFPHYLARDGEPFRLRQSAVKFKKQVDCGVT